MAVATGGRKTGLALAGGGPAGAIYEIGALRALDEAFAGLDFTDLHVYVGVSAGAFICANLANNITPAQMTRAIVKHQPGEHPFVPETFYALAIGEYVKRGLSVPGLLRKGNAARLNGYRFFSPGMKRICTIKA